MFTRCEPAPRNSRGCSVLAPPSSSLQARNTPCKYSPVVCPKLPVLIVSPASHKTRNKLLCPSPALPGRASSTPTSIPGFLSPIAVSSLQFGARQTSLRCHLALTPNDSSVFSLLILREREHRENRPCPFVFRNTREWNGASSTPSSSAGFSPRKTENTPLGPARAKLSSAILISSTCLLLLLPV